MTATESTEAEAGAATPRARGGRGRARKGALLSGSEGCKFES